jgi:DNA-binding response OmpR family regulator
MMRVAWVDDEPSIRYVARRVLERCGAVCLEFADHAALLAVVDGSFDAAVLHVMDDVPADEVRVELRRRGVGILLIASGWTATEVQSRGIDVAAFDGFLGKPFSFREMAERLGLGDERGEAAS